MLPIGKKLDLTKIVRKKYDCANEKYTKYGEEISIADFVNASREGTEAKKIIGKTVSMEELKRITKELKNTPEGETIDMNIDPYMANKIMKISKFKYDKLVKEKEIMEELKQQEKKEKEVNDAK